ncbi:MAG: tRNA (adenosine(37)-N6)-threonylcarbamoyltransferase complex transferase subunit TsaD [Acidobacteria bacterium]|nr:MAG: tRNA (adenosine(37)-N6)-threonylcarbamoyltransferase complex transferase subunit TsaD [Acidobacteriota bacterium]
MKVLGLETSCDDTAAGVVTDRHQVLASIVASQIEIHGPYGGVVPELASRGHMDAVGPVIAAALKAARLGWGDLDGIAVTHGPGLVGSLLVGVSTAKALSFAHGVPLLGVNHLEAHVRSVFLDHPDLVFPMLSLVVSGGHTSIYVSREEGRYELLAETRDDAAGEAFDKVAKYLGFGYPGGPVVDRLAASGDDRAFKFSRPRMSDGSLDFSFSGLKTAALLAMGKEGIQPLKGNVNDLPAGEIAAEDVPQVIRDLFASFQRAVVEFLVHRVRRLVADTGISTVTMAGGVACNSRLRIDLAAAGEQDGFSVAWPRPAYCSDNGAMVAAAGCLLLRQGRVAGLDLDAVPGLTLADSVVRP